MTERSRDVATPAERGHDLRTGREAEPAPKDRRHELETVDDHDGPPVERCRHCQRVRSIGAIDPFAECPERRENTPEEDGEPAPEASAP